MQWLHLFNFIIGLLFSLCYLYQYIYIMISLFRKPKHFSETENRYRYAVLISARNEQRVIGQLCDSIRAQDYPAELLDIFVVADNCTDNTKTVAREHGATVYERSDEMHRGKGYALRFLFECIFRDFGKDAYDGYFVVDADNLLDAHFVSEMNKAFNAGHRIITSYRNSKNYGDNWISAGYSLWFLRDARQLNAVRHRLGVGCVVAGTGFLVHKDIVKEMNGWNYFLLTEDIEFTIDQTLKGEKIAYCHDAILYDEQPVRFSQSWRQRLRWCAGYLQVLRRFGGKMIAKFFRGSFSCYDMLMSLSPAFLLSSLITVVNLGAILFSALFARELLGALLLGVLPMVVGAYLLLFLTGLAAMLCERKRIHASRIKKIAYLFTFPIFIFTYLPISICSLFSKVSWKPIEHKVTLSIGDLESGPSKNQSADPTAVSENTTERSNRHALDR